MCAIALAAGCPAREEIHRRADVGDTRGAQGRAFGRWLHTNPWQPIDVARRGAVRCARVAAEYRGSTSGVRVKKGAFSALHRRLPAKSLFAIKGNRFIHYSRIFIGLSGFTWLHFRTTAYESGGWR
jgi:hypothetical protein